MPKQTIQESVLHDWVHTLPFQMQALLLTAMRGPDENNKYNAAKGIIRYLRGVVIKPAGDWHGKNDNDFMWGEYERDEDPTSVFYSFVDKFISDHDEYPHHFIMHLVHCAEVVGYKHPSQGIRSYWSSFYFVMCEQFHMNPETKDQMDLRLNDFGCGIHKKIKDQEMLDNTNKIASVIGPFNAILNRHR